MLENSSAGSIMERAGCMVIFGREWIMSNVEGVGGSGVGRRMEIEGWKGTVHVVGFTLLDCAGWMVEDGGWTVEGGG